MEIYKGTIPIPPRTKKNHQEIRYRNIKGKRVPFIAQSQIYKDYERDCGYFIKRPREPFKGKYNVKAYYYLDTKRKTDLNNLHSALHDILVTYGVLEDDNYNIIAATDGSRVYVDKENPRTEYFITEII